MKNKAFISIVFASLMLSQAAATTFTSPGEGKVKVSLESYGYVVDLPLEVRLRKEKKKESGYCGNYSLSAKGLIEDQNTLNIIPDAEVRMLDNKGNEILAKISQEHTGWKNNPGNKERSIINNDTTIGTLKIEKVPEPGEYKGTLYFDISISE